MRSQKVPELPVGPVERTATLDLMLSQQVKVGRLIVFVVYSGCVVVVVEVQMKTVELRRSCIPEVRLQMIVIDVFDVEGNGVVIGMEIDVVIDMVIGVVLVVVFEVVLVVVVAVVVVELVEAVAVEVEPLGIDEVVVAEH